MKNERYSMSFTSGGLHYQESVLIAELFQELKDWGKVKEKVYKDNVLQAQAQKTMKTKYREVYGKLKLLSKKEIDIIVNGTRQEQNHILWLAVCKRYRFIAEFAKEILRENYLKMEPILSKDDFESFFNQKATWHEELEQLSPNTKYKLKQVIFKTLRDAEIIDKKNVIVPTIFTPKLVSILKKDSPQGFEVFPVNDNVIRN